MTSDEWNNNDQETMMNPVYGHSSDSEKAANDYAFFADFKSEAIDLVLSVAIVVLLLSLFHQNAENLPILLLVVYWGVGYGFIKLIRYVIRTHRVQ